LPHLPHPHPLSIDYDREGLGVKGRIFGNLICPLLTLYKSFALYRARLRRGRGRL